MAWPYLRNVAQEFDFPLFDASGNLVNESGTITKQVVIDGQNFVNVSGSVTQYGTSGVYKFSGQAPDWNGARLTFKFTSAIVKPTVLTFHTDSKRFSDIPSLADLKAQAENAMTAYGALKTSVSGRLLDVSAGGEAGLDWANIGSPTTPQNLSATTISGVNSMAPPGPTSQDIWSFATRTITNKTGFSIAGTKTTLDALNDVSASGVWGNATRTLTSAGAGGATAQEVWEYGTRSLTDKDGFNLAADQTTVRFSGYVSDPGKAPTTQDIWAFATRVITDKAGFSLAADQSGVTIGAVAGAVGSVTGNVGGNVTGSVGSVGQSGISPATLGADVREQIARDVIRRGMARDETALENRSLGWAIAKLVNKIDIDAAGTTLTIRRTNDTTALFTQTLTTSGGAAPITAADTA